jgi:hypothetical protein
MASSVQNAKLANFHRWKFEPAVLGENLLNMTSAMLLNAQFRFRIFAFLSCLNLTPPPPSPPNRWWRRRRP